MGDSYPHGKVEKPQTKSGEAEPHDAAPAGLHFSVAPREEVTGKIFN